jgi:ABA DEFICIENT 4-like
MTPDRLFSIANAIALAAWMTMIVLHRRSWVLNILIGRVVPAVFAAIYVGIVPSAWAGSTGGFSSLAGVAALFSNRWLLLAGWLHYLAFDLLIGRWELVDAQAHGIGIARVVPCLLLTFMFGPAGWLLYMIVRLTGSSRAVPSRAA